MSMAMKDPVVSKNNLAEKYEEVVSNSNNALTKNVETMLRMKIIKPSTALVDALNLVNQWKGLAQKTLTGSDAISIDAQIMKDYKQTIFHHPELSSETVEPTVAVTTPKL